MGIAHPDPISRLLRNLQEPPGVEALFVQGAVRRSLILNRVEFQPQLCTASKLRPSFKTGQHRPASRAGAVVGGKTISILRPQLNTTLHSHHVEA